MTTIEHELIELKARLERLEAHVYQGAPAVLSLKPPLPGEPLDHERLLAWLQTEGLIIEPPPVAQRHAEAWYALSQNEKEAIEQELDHLPPGPMASDIVIDNRS